MHTCNDANQLISEICGLTSTAYTYDPNGNLTAKTDSTGTTTWAYDSESGDTILVSLLFNLGWTTA